MSGSSDGRPFHLGINTLFLIPGQVGGAETYLREILRALVPLLPGRCTLFTNLENDAILRKDLEKVRNEHGIAFDCLGFRATNRYQRIVREQFQLARRAKRARCDVLWSPGYTACLATRIPQAVTIHDVQYRRFPQDLSLVGWLATHLLVMGGVRRCRRVIAISEFSKEEIVRFTKVPPSKIDVTLEGVSTCFSDEPFPLPDESPYLLCVAGSYPHKNLPSLVRAFDHVADKIPHRLVLVGGEGLGEGSLREAIASAVHRDRIERKQGIPCSKLLSLYQRADLFILPSLYEGFGLPVLEAQLAGVPVLTTGRASIAEVGGESLFLYDPEERGALEKGLLEALSMTPEERGRRVEAGRENARTFTWHRTAELTLASLEATVSGKRR